MPEPNFAYVIPMEDELLHTQTRLFCFVVVNPTCPCRDDLELLREVAVAVNDGLLTLDEAQRFIRGEML